MASYKPAWAMHIHPSHRIQNCIVLSPHFTGHKVLLAAWPEGTTQPTWTPVGAVVTLTDGTVLEILGEPRLNSDEAVVQVRVISASETASRHWLKQDEVYMLTDKTTRAHGLEFHSDREI